MTGQTMQTLLAIEGAENPEHRLEILASPGFMEWLTGHQASLAVTTYQVGKLLMLGVEPDGRLALAERTFNRCMGLAGNDQTIYMSTLYQVWRMENALPPGERTADGHDRLFIPQAAYTTGDIDVHDMGVDRTGRLVFVNTLFGCLATLSEDASFAPLWQPPFLTRLAAEDRCHLNGLAMRDGWPAFVTAVSQSDIADGWRDDRRDGGVVVDVASGAIAATGLSMPHSPRWHDGRLWLLNAGTGELGTVDLDRGSFEPVVFCPGFLRGMTIVDGFAVLGASRARENRTFTGLVLDDRLAAPDSSASSAVEQAGRGRPEPRCGLFVVNLERGAIEHELRFEGIVSELYDVLALPAVTRPKVVGLRSQEISRTITIGRNGC